MRGALRLLSVASRFRGCAIFALVRHRTLSFALPTAKYSPAYCLCAMAISIKSAERVDGGLAIEFSDGTVIFYNSESLFERRGDVGNRLMEAESDEDWLG
jgi:hypothetical protein